MAEAIAVWILASAALYAAIVVISLIGWIRSTIPQKAAALPIHVIVPAHNEAKVIGELLEDLSRQDYSTDNFRVIVVDDRSTDTTAEIVQSYNDKLPVQLMQIQSLPKGVHGKLHAMYRATADLTEGSVLMIDADCRVRSGWVRNMAEGAATGGAVGPVFEIGAETYLKEMLSCDQAGITFAAMGLIASGYPLTASTANMLIPVEAIRSGLWDRIGTNGTGEDGRILQDQFKRGFPMRPVLERDSVVLTRLAPTFGDTARARRRWYQDATTYDSSVKASQIVLGLVLTGLLIALPGLLYAPLRFYAGIAIAGKFLMDSIAFFLVRRRYPFFTFRSLLLWSPLQSWFLLTYAIYPKPKKARKRGFADR